MNASSLYLRAVIVGVALMCATASAALPPETQETLSRWLEGNPGGIVVALIDASGVEFAQAGTFSTDNPKRVNPDSQFEIGSISKVFTATLFAESRRLGKVELDDPVGLPFAPSRITYRQLVTHTSGLPDHQNDFAHGDPFNPYGVESMDRLVATFDSQSLNAHESPWSYSNLGIAVLGQALAKIWNTSYEEVLLSRILEPLQLKSTTTSWRKADPARLAPGHTNEGRQINWDFVSYTPAGGIVSSARDLAHFVQASLGLVRSPLAADLLETTKPLKPVGDWGNRIGMVWNIGRWEERTIVSHSGATGGYRSFVAFDPAAKRGIIVLANSSVEVTDLGEALLMNKLKALPLWRNVVSLDEDSIAEYVGRYEFSSTEILTITAQNHKISAQVTGNLSLPLFASAKDKLFAKSVNVLISFQREVNGKVTGLIWRQNDWDRHVNRLPERREIQFEGTALKDYPGVYIVSPQFSLTVKLEGAILYVEPTGQDKAPLFAAQKDQFFVKIADTQFSFTRDSDGKINGLVMLDNGQQILAKRAGKPPAD
jgi:CubicO group peptidase (beta-lactamase class C family)